MRSVLIVVVYLWFITRIVAAFRITNEFNIDNLTSKTFDGTSLLAAMNSGGSQDNQTIDGFIEFDRNSSRANDTLDFDEPSPSGVVAITTSINLNHTIQHRALVESSRDPVRGIIFRQKVKPEARSFFGLIIIPCKWEKCLENLCIFDGIQTFLRSILSLPLPRPKWNNIKTDIVCFFASKGFWPFYPPMLQYQVNEMGKKIFALSDDRVKQFCRGKFNFQETCYRPGKTMRL